MDMYSLVPLTYVGEPWGENEVELPVETPHRNDPTLTRNALEVINDVVQYIPNFSITFEGDGFDIITNFQAPSLMMAQASNGVDVPTQLDDILQLMDKKLKNAGHGSLKIVPLNIDVTPEGLTGRSRNVIYNVRGSFVLEEK